ncbi:MAG: hypothetical protein M3466_16265 [Gemmatimonadota bacterium]|nr:hypothetical protein [Gemmatimonadota bacterium]
MLLVKRALAWAVSGSLIGVILWALIGGTLALVYHPSQTLAETLRDWALSVAFTGFWAVFIAAIAAPAYSILFGLWQLVLRRHPYLDATAKRQAIGAFALAAPPAVMLTVGFATSIGFAFDWQEAAQTFPIAILSCGGAVYLPRRLVPMLRRPLGAPAG